MPATMHYNKHVIDNNDSLTLQDVISKKLSVYFQNVGEAMPQNLYELVMSEIELPLLEAVMEFTNNNQSQAAKILGINRGTFRKKLAFYNI